MQTVAVLDFETTGLSPNMGDRATEIAVILLRDGEIVDRFQSLMNAGRRIPSDVVALTGITNEMIAAAPPASTVMQEAAAFVGKHGRRSQRRFRQTVLAVAGLLGVSAEMFACTMLVARRIYPDARSHRLSSLWICCGCRNRAVRTGRWSMPRWPDTRCRLQHDIARTYGLNRIDHALMTRVQATAKAKVPTYLRSLVGAHA